MTALRKCLITASAVLVFSVPLRAETRTFAGTFTSNWKTEGHHGHDQPMCAGPRITYPAGGVLWEEPNCNPTDFGRGNLDNSIGFRGGRERDLFPLGPLSLVGGVEGSLSYTEYNLSQQDFIFAAAAATAGADLRLGPIRIGGRIGAGPFATSDGGEYGFQRFLGAHITVPLRPGAAIRVSQQSMRVFAAAPPHGLYDWERAESADVRREPNAMEVSILLVASPEYLGTSQWDFAATTGMTSPGGGIGSGRGLRQSSYSQITAFRDLPWANLQGRISWTASAHESTLPATFRGYDGNYRSKTIDAYGLSLGGTRRLLDHLSFRYGAGIEVADWRDEHHLLTRNGEELVAGIEAGISGDFGLRWHIGRNLALETSVEKVYWRSMDLGEGRWGFGLVVTR